MPPTIFLGDVYTFFTFENTSANTPNLSKHRLSVSFSFNSGNGVPWKHATPAGTSVPRAPPQGGSDVGTGTSCPLLGGRYSRLRAYSQQCLLPHRDTLQWHYLPCRCGVGTLRSAWGCAEGSRSLCGLRTIYRHGPFLMASGPLVSLIALPSHPSRCASEDPPAHISG